MHRRRPSRHRLASGYPSDRRFLRRFRCARRRAFPVAQAARFHHRIVIESGVVGKVDPCVGMDEHAAHEHDDIDVWRLRAIDRARLHRLKDEPAFRVGACPVAAKALERRVRASRVGRMGITAFAAACQISIRASAMGWLAPSNTRPSIRMRSPTASAVTTFPSAIPLKV
jgi:hypothetical protein